MPIDYKKYPANWLSEIRPRIMERAKNRCEFCGLEHNKTAYATKFAVRHRDGKYKLRVVWFSNEQDAIREQFGYNIYPVKVVLTIAHLDHDENNPDPQDDRLKALCQICHLRYDAKEKYRRRTDTEGRVLAH